MTPPKFNGRRASRHSILRQLGHGNLTRVFLAAPRAAPRGELVVLKVMHQELAKDDDFRALFLDQAVTTLSLRHPNLVRTLDVVAEPDACGLSMEFLQGQTLARVIERVGRHRFPVDLHLHILSKVLAALDHAHASAGPRHADSGFMHRDVCPSNVFITFDGQVKLLGTGFGSAVRALESRLGRPLMDVKYAAPELLLGYPSGTSADLFSVGVMVWEALTRQARVHSDDPKAVVRWRTSGEELDLESAWPDASEPSIALCTRALSVSPRERYPTAFAFRADLDAYLARAPETSDAVLARLPELMEATFGPEREQMQLFIGARLEAVDSEAAGEPAMGEVDEEVTPDGDEWTAETNTTSALADRSVREAGASEGFRTGLRRARPEPVRRETGIHPKGLRHSGAQPLPARSERPSHGSSLREADAAEPSAIAPGPHGLPSPSSLEPPPHETTTAGHRAYSTNLDSNAQGRRGGFRLSPDVLGAAALLAGSLVAAYSVYRHSQRDKKPESDQLAIQAEARMAQPTPLRVPSQLASAALPAAAGDVPRPGSIDAGAELGVPRVQGPAFFDGHAASSTLHEAAPSLRADELPAVDPALSSLQDAIVLAAKAHRGAPVQRRAKKAEPAPRPRPAAPMAPRPIDETDPYGGSGAP